MDICYVCEVNKTKIPKLRLKIRLGAQMNGDNISIITYSKDYLSILLQLGYFCTLPFRGNYRMTEYMGSHQRIHVTVINAPTLTRSQIRSKLNRKLSDSCYNIERSRNNTKLF